MRKSIYSKYYELKDVLSEAASDLQDLYKIQNENRYLTEFIKYMNLEREYNFYKSNAHEEQSDDDPFPPLIL